MPRSTRRKKARAPRLINPQPVRPPLWDSDEDYDSDVCIGLGYSLEQRARSKLLSALHGAWVDLADDDFAWPNEYDDYNITTAEPTLDMLGAFLVETQEAVAWLAEARGVSGSDAVSQLCEVYRELRKEDRVVGDRALIEVFIVSNAYVEIFREIDEFKAQLAAPMELRKVRVSAAPTTGTSSGGMETTTVEEVIRRMETLKANVEAALEACGETLF